jgi:hypothetical protein
MQRCIYCRTNFEKAPKEHIVNAFLGARWKNGTLICQDCQSAFANGIDTALYECLQPLRLLLNIEGDHGGTGEKLTDLPVTSGGTVDLGPGGTPIIRKPHVAITESPDGHRNASIKIGREQDLNWALSILREKIPDVMLDVEAIKQLGVKKNERLDGAVTFDVTFAGAEFRRAVLKCCANLFASHDEAGRIAFLTPAFDAARAFVHNGTGADGDFVRWVISDKPLELPNCGPADQSILLTTRNGSVEGVIRFFGQLAFAVRLTNNYAGPPFRCAYVVDPYREADPAEHRLRGEALARYDSETPVFLEQSSGINAASQVAFVQALHRLLGHYSERENEKIFQEATNAAISQDARFAALPREQVVEMMRSLAKKRFERFEQTGDATGIITVGIKLPKREPPAERAAE